MFIPRDWFHAVRSLDVSVSVNVFYSTLADLVPINHRAAPGTPRQRAILDFAVKMARTPDALEEGDYDALAAHAVSPEDIWDIAGITGLFALSNRMAHVTGMVPNDQFYTLGR